MPHSSACARVLTVLVIALAAAVPGSSALAEDLRLGNDVVPTSQSISLTLDAGTSGYSGSTVVELDVRGETDTFRFHAEEMSLDRILLLGKDGPVDLEYTVGTRGMVTVTTSRKLATGSYRLEIAFTDDFNTDAVGLYRMEEDGEGYSFTQFEADDAREAFPCWDEPGFKIPYQLTLTVPEDHLAVTNTPVEKETAEGGWKTLTFQTTKPLPSYLLAIATGPLETVDLPDLGFSGRVVTVRGQSHLTEAARETTAPILRALEAYFGSPYPFEKLDLIAVPEYWPGAMENPGAITYSDNILLLDPAATTVAQKRRLARVTAHEIAHMWFGNLVTMEWWDDLWLNESFADWMGDKITHQVYPELRWDLTALEGTLEVMAADARPSTHPIRRTVVSTDNLFEGVGLAYDKGKAVLGMFEHWIGPESFRRGVLAYLEAHAWGNAAAADLWAELDRSSGKGLSEALAGFIEQPGFPLVEVAEVSGGKVRLTQERFHGLGVDQPNHEWKIPVGLKFSRGGKVETTTVLLDSREKTFDLGGDLDWVYPNAGSYGYYRWSIPESMLALITAGAGTHLDARERIGLISNAGAIMTSGRMTGDVYLRTLNSLADDPDPIVLSSLLDALEGIEMAFVTPGTEADFAAYVRSTLGPALDRIGLAAKPGEDETLSLIRPRLVAWMGNQGQDPRITALAGEMCRAYLADPGSVDPSLAPVMVRMAARHGDRELYEEFRTRAESASSPGVRSLFLGSLGTFRDPELRAAALEYALGSSVRPNELFMVIDSMSDTEEGRELTYRWVTGNYDAILARLPGEFAMYMPFVASGCSEDRLAAARIFFSDPGRRAPGSDRQLARIADQVGECVDLREREGEVVSRYLAEFLEKR